LSPSDVRSFLAAKRAAGLSVTTVKQLHAILRSALAHAVREDLIARNVARLVVVPSAPRCDVQPLTVVEARRLLVAASEDRYRALWVLLLTAGLRRGEVLGLRWADLDLDNGVLRVRQTLQRAGGRLQLVPPKSERSRRSVPLASMAVVALRDHRLKMAREFLTRGQRLSDDDLVFLTAKGTPVEPRNLNRSFVALLRAAKLRHIRLHDLRHTCATLLLAQGIPARVVMETLGHSAIAVTMNTYSHVMPSLLRDAADRMDEVLKA
jgi:integrase